LEQQVSVVVAGGNRDSKQKRLANSAETNPRCQPRPQLQYTHQISDLQKINQSPAIQRKTFQEICQQYDLDLNQLLHEVDKSPYLTSLPISVDKYTQIDVWDSLCVHLHSNIHNLKVNMQRIHSKSAIGGHASRNDLVFFITSEDTAVSAAKLRGKLIDLSVTLSPVTDYPLTACRLFDWPGLFDIQIITYYASPAPPLDGTCVCVW
jgi:hypothetical protein